MLFVSEKAFFQEKKAIRGGVPICWPWFGDYLENPAYPAHGFVRNNFWQVTTAACLANGDTQIILEFIGTEKTKELWPYKFKLALSIIVGDSLNITLTTTNHGEQAFSISEALHAYFNVGNINDIEILGLEDTDFLDKTRDFSQRHQPDSINILAETDRIYLKPSNNVIIDDKLLNRKIKIESSGNQNVVVWNPWSNGASAISDLKDNAYCSFVCVEAANALPGSIKVPPGQSHTVKTSYSIIRD